MNEPIAIAIFTGGLVLLVSAGTVWALRRLRGAREAGFGGAALQPDSEGVVIVPVTGTYTTGGFGAFTRNSLGGALAIAPDGIRFKVLVKGAWSFSEIEQVDVRKTLFGASLVFMNREGGRTLAALPPGVPLTARAATVREGEAATANTPRA